MTLLPFGTVAQQRLRLHSFRVFMGRKSQKNVFVWSLSLNACNTLCCFLRSAMKSDILSRFCCCRGFAKKEAEKKGKYWRVFSLKELHAATNNFNYDNKLGEGLFGSVYWGQLWDGSQIAVKRLKIWSTKPESDFAVEVEILGRIRHKNLLSLRGYCAEGQERLIVYDYMPNLSVLSHLRGHHAADNVLDWSKRMNIAVGSAEGLAYLHNYATPHIIHRDIKATNILLDSDFNPKVADYGFAKLVPDGASHITIGNKSILGYLAPECAIWGKGTESCDVYSFGILLLELVSGRRPMEKSGSTVTRTIVDWALPLLLEGKYGQLADPKLQGNYNEEELKRVVHVALVCVHTAPEKRLTMLEVVDLLSGESKERLSKMVNGISERDFKHVDEEKRKEVEPPADMR